MVKIRYSKAKKSVDKKQNRRITKLERKVGDPEYKQIGALYPGAGSLPGQLSNAVSVSGISDFVARGTGSSERVGDQITVHKIRFRLCAQYLGNKGGQFVRVLIGQDFQYNGAGTDPTGAQLLTTYDLIDNTVTNAQSPVNADFCTLKGLDTKKVKGSKFFNILYDKVIWLPTITQPGTNVSVVYPMKTISWEKTFKRGLNVQYSGANQKSGRIFVAIFPGNDTTAADNPFINANTEIYWKDL